MSSHSTPPGEFDLIERFFKTGANSLRTNADQAITLGIGDDCALIKPGADEEVAITSDMLVEGRHFFAGANPELLGRKALAVNLSDLAAMGARPIGFTLAIALPTVDNAWLEAFSKGLFAMAAEYSCPLIGGDTTAGPLTLSITAFGAIPTGEAIRRSGAMPGDDIWISGTVGDARLTLAALRHEINLPAEDLQQIEHRMHNPTPRTELGVQLRNIASSALDVSDGLLGDLRHILKQSQVDAEIQLGKLPKSATLQKQGMQIQKQFSACGGDDYEICFTAPESQRDKIEAISKSIGLPLTIIGKTVLKNDVEAKVYLLDESGILLSDAEAAPFLKSFDHFAS
ncbi:thiamine-phosphate kinase [Polynucleobacter sp. AP-Capit-er-40B-B4]|uniref:thiamine-phosphate kinase n=1 Tax=Polynucleobacter sp. AP-Capit-er-40B-B4 TaxID=2576927 RepID=UPI001C0D1F2A|nr:thiamine-phosphate kinase [Polynucleobacter sp. AP-Capit-er-40B-B4]MBU3581091.1 thiamine-phosphate kinase [Polynucleobacter sp. AP-Capit-er-40B-B4]